MARSTPTFGTRRARTKTLIHQLSAAQGVRIMPALRRVGSTFARTERRSAEQSADLARNEAYRFRRMGSRRVHRKAGFSRGGGVTRHDGGLWGPPMNIADGGHDAPLTPRGRLLFIGSCVARGIVGVVLLILARW